MRTLNREVANPRESDKDLKNEDFSAKLEAELRESVNVLRKLLVSEIARLNEALTDLKSELFSPRLEDEPSETLKLSA